MPVYKKLFSTKTSEFEIKLYEFDITDEVNFERLKEYLKDKVRHMKVHNTERFDVNYYMPKNIDPSFAKKLNESINNINTPASTSIPAFDVRRERITEWMAQSLLEKEYECLFYDEADKRMNIDPVCLNKHTPGVDVPGLRIVENDVKFVICEVKASEEEKIPCSSSKGLLEDITKGYSNENNRVTTEILNYMQGIKQSNMEPDQLLRITNFLAKLLIESHEELMKNIVFFPVLIRNNTEISSKHNVDDFKDFRIENVKAIDLENIILSFASSINDFTTTTYNEAIGK